MDGEQGFQPLDADSGPIPPQQHWLWRPGLIVFISSACTMILELVAGRIVAPYVGVSLYTWTSVIGVVLAGISLGNFLGGRLADRYASTGLLGGIFVLGGLSAFGILAADPLGSIMPGAWPIVVNILLLTAALFFLPCLILGMVSPVVAKLAVQDLARTGSTVGRIYAISAVGSIVGTFATGFVLIAWFGTHAVVWGVGLALLALGLLFLLEHRWRMMLLFAVVLAGASVVVLRQGWTHGPCTLETNYFCIRVHDEEREGGLVRVLVLDRLVHSYTSLDDPTKLVYGYERVYAEIADQRAREDDHLRALFIGGGGYTFPKYMEALYPASDVHVIEIDPGVTLVARQLLDLTADTHIVTYNEDARMFLERAPTERYDLIVGDAFNDFSVPYHLTTREFNERVRAWLVDDGLYLVNIIDGAGGEFLRSYTHTLSQIFEHVTLVPTIDSWRQSPRSTFVLVASDAPLDLSAFESGGSGSLLLRHVLPEEEVDRVLAEGRKVTLTDQYAPVDQMLAPVFRDEMPE